MQGEELLPTNAVNALLNSDARARSNDHSFPAYIYYVVFYVSSKNPTHKKQRKDKDKNKRKNKNKIDGT
jgi:hypothetical protein